MRQNVLGRAEDERQARKCFEIYIVSTSYSPLFRIHPYYHGQVENGRIKAGRMLRGPANWGISGHPWSILSMGTKCLWGPFHVYGGDAKQVGKGWVMVKVWGEGSREGGNSWKKNI